MYTKKWFLRRRTVLRGVLGGAATAVGLPLLECMLDEHGEALAQDGSPLPKRYGVFFWGNGVRPDRWIPRVRGAQWWNDPNEELRPIADDATIRDQVSVFSRFRALDSSGTVHHRTRAQVLTGTYRASPNGTCCGSATGPSSDWLVRRAWAGQAAQRDALDLGVSRAHKNSGLGLNNGTVHNDSGGRPNLQMDPRAAFDALFPRGLPETEGKGNDQLVAARRRVVDMVRADAARLQSRLGANDRRRLSDHLEHLHGVERRIESFGSANGCQLPRLTANPLDAYSGTRTRISDGSSLIGEDLAEKNAVMAELTALALACDLTRVFTFQHHGMQTDTVFWNLPSVTLGSHQSTHDDRENSPNPEAPDYGAVHEIATFIMGQFAVLLNEFARLPEGGGVLLDNTAIYATSEYGDASAHNQNTMIALVAGGGGGKLKTGHHFDGGGSRNIVEIPYTIMKDVLGLDIDGFGSGTSRATRTFAEMVE